MAMKPAGKVDWQRVMTSRTREKILAGRVPALIFDGSRPPVEAGTIVVLEWAWTSDPELGEKYQYALRWITVRKVSRNERGTPGWKIEYTPPERAAVWLRKTGGYTTDPFTSIDPEAEALRTKVTPFQRAANTVAQERRRIELELDRHLRRLRYTKNPESLRRLPSKIERCRKMLADLTHTDDREAA